MYGWATSSYPFTCWINSPICAILIRLHCVPQQLEEGERNWVGFTGCVLHEGAGAAGSKDEGGRAPSQVLWALFFSLLSAGTGRAQTRPSAACRKRVRLRGTCRCWGVSSRWRFSRGQGCQDCVAVVTGNRACCPRNPTCLPLGPPVPPWLFRCLFLAVLRGRIRSLSCP